MCAKLLILTFIIFLTISSGRCANILGFFQFPSKSHHILSSALLKGLVKNGHNVTVISPFPLAKKMQNYTDIVLTNIMDWQKDYLDKVINSTRFTFFQDLLTSIRTMADVVLNDEEMQKLLNSKTKFDAIIMLYPFTEPFFGMAHHFNAPIILFTSVGINTMVNTIAGNINPYSYVPNAASTMSDTMSFIERVLNTLMGVAFELINTFLIFPEQKSASAKYFPNAPPLEELIKKYVSLFLINSHYSTETPRPYTPNLIQIGGFHLQDPDPLPKELKEYLDGAKDGVVYFSFGTNVEISKLSKDKLDVIMKCLGRLKEDVLWKVETKNIVGLPKNVRIEEWLPQRSILAHPNVKAFITHGGLGGVVEAMHAGVPMLATPFFGDQTKNVADVVNANYAISFNFDDLTEEIFSHSLDEILNNPIYRNNIRKVSGLINYQPIKPLEKAIYWIEHVIKYNGTDHLKPASASMNIIQHLNLDVFAFLIATLTAIILIAYRLIKCLYSLIFGRKVAKKEKIA